jgi:hypothetical protein
MVHHIIWRSKGGVTTPSNLLTACRDCHAMIHAGLIVVEGAEPGARITDRHGQSLTDPAPDDDDEPGMSISFEISDESGRRDSAGEKESGRPDSRSEKKSRRLDSFVSLQTLPAQVDTAFFRQVRHLLSGDPRAGVLILSEGERRPVEEGSEGAAAMASGASPVMASSVFRPTRFEDIVGQSSAVAALRQSAQAAQMRGDASPHVLLTGTPGLGKTTLAQALAAERGATCHAMIHAGLIDFEGAEPGARITDRHGRSLTDPASDDDAAAGTSISFEVSDESGRPDSGGV